MGIIIKFIVIGNKFNNVLKFIIDGKKIYIKCICKLYIGILKYRIIYVVMKLKYLCIFE